MLIDDNLYKQSSTILSDHIPGLFLVQTLILSTGDRSLGHFTSDVFTLSLYLLFGIIMHYENYQGTDFMQWNTNPRN